MLARFGKPEARWNYRKREAYATSGGNHKTRLMPDIGRVPPCCLSCPARQRLGVRWVRGEGTHRFHFGPPQASRAVSAPFPASHPTPKTSRQFERFSDREELPVWHCGRCAVGARPCRC
jgi:hypothetical protein